MSDERWDDNRQDSSVDGYTAPHRRYRSDSSTGSGQNGGRGQGGYGSQGSDRGRNGYGNQGGGQNGYGNQGGGQNGYGSQGGGQNGYSSQGGGRNGYGSQGGSGQNGYGSQGGSRGQGGYSSQGGRGSQNGYSGQGYDSRYEEYDNYPTREANYERGGGRGRGYKDSRQRGTSSYESSGSYGTYENPYLNNGNSFNGGGRNNYSGNDIVNDNNYSNQRYNDGFDDDLSGRGYGSGSGSYERRRGSYDRQNRQYDNSQRERGSYDSYEQDSRSGARGETGGRNGRYGGMRGDRAASGGFDIRGMMNDLWLRLGDTDDQRKVRLILICCGVLITIGVILCICLQTCSSCGSGCAGSEIPVIEQGDGDELPGGQAQTEVVTITDGAVVISQDAGAVDDFTVTVSGANGTYNRTNVSRNEAATLKIEQQDQTGFTFTLNVNGGEVSGYAYFTGANTAAYELAEGLIGFTFENSTVKVYHTMQISNFGGASADGTYITGTPTYNEETSAASVYDADIRTADATQSALKAIMPQSDYSLMNSIFSDGVCPVYQNSETTLDRNGREILVDSQMKAVKYYAFVNGTGEELVLICANSGKVYVGICDGGEYRYYTNDDNYKAAAPLSISDQAATKNMQLRY